MGTAKGYLLAHHQSFYPGKAGIIQTNHATINQNLRKPMDRFIGNPTELKSIAFN